MAASVPQGSSAKPSFNQLVQLAKLSGQKPPSTWSVLDNTLGAITGMKPSQLGKGAYAWRHPINVYNKAQKSTTPSMGELPFTPGGGLFKIFDEGSPAAMTHWASGQGHTIADTRRMMGPEAAQEDAQMFHMHAADEHGNVVGAMHGFGGPKGVHVVSAKVEPGANGAVQQMWSKVVSFADANHLPVSGDLMNPKLAPLLVRWARTTERDVAHTHSGRMVITKRK